MSVAALRADHIRCRRTEQRTVSVSTAVHVLFLWLLWRNAPVPDVGTLTEVSLLEGPIAAPTAPAAPAPAQAATETQAGVLEQRKEELRFRRPVDDGDMAPDQTSRVFEDRLNERLATLQRTAPAPIAGLATVEPRQPQLAQVGGAGAPAGTGGGSPLALERGPAGGSGGTSPLALVRGPQTTGTPRLATAALPADRPSGPTRATTVARPRASLSGVSLAGPIADRPVLEVTRPVYPDWAKQEAVEGSVTLYFIVSPDGSVQDNILVQKTAGFQDFDDGAVAALRRWVFAPLPRGRTGDQWGTITFHYRLAEAR